MTALESHTPSFIFRDEDFAIDQEEFDAAAFVTRFRRVTPLESLREQLVAYSNHVRKQLYVIINRDYKDFITIATKLDGLDTRLQMVQRPLLDLRIDLSSLHNGITTSLHTIQDKISARKEIVQRRQCLEQILCCMDELVIANAALSSDHTETSNRHSLHRSLDRMRAMDKGSTTPIINAADIFTCSQFESAASSLQTISDNLHHLAVLLPSGQHATKGGLSSLPMLHKVLLEQLAKTKDGLLVKLSAHIEHYFTTAATTVSPANRMDIASVMKDNRGLAHCLRALLCIGQGTAAEGILAHQLTPQVRSLLSQGKVDGKEGKGSYSGFKDALQSVLQYLSSHSLLGCLVLGEQLAADNEGGLDLLVNGVLVPLFAVIQEKFQQIFSIGIAAIFSACYRSLMAFLADLSALVSGTQLSRLLAHPTVSGFLHLFKVDTYYQLRQREVTLRADKACELHVKALLSHHTTKLMDALYRSNDSRADHIGMSKGGVMMSLPPSDLPPVGKKYAQEIFAVFATEVLTILHGHVSILPIYSKALGLVQRLLMRLAMHVALHCNIFLPTLFASKAEFDALRGTYFDPTTYQPPSASMPPPAPVPVAPGSAVKGKLETPVKSRETGTPSKAPATPSAPAVPAVNVSVSIEESLRIALDTLHFIRFLHSEELQAFVKASSCMSTSSSTVLADVWPFGTSSYPGEAILLALYQGLWKQITANIIAEGKKALSGVKAIAPKYRMTGKTVTGVSPYTENILGPLRTVLKDFQPSLADLAGAASGGHADSKYLLTWQTEVCLAITADFHLQLVSLFDGTRKMVTTLRKGNSQDTFNIALQAERDVDAFGEDLQRLGLLHGDLQNAFEKVKAEVNKMRLDVEFKDKPGVPAGAGGAAAGEGNGSGV